MDELMQLKILIHGLRYELESAEYWLGLNDPLALLHVQRGLADIEQVIPKRKEGEQMNIEQAAKLRAPFDKAQIGLLPRATKTGNPKGNCNVCGGYHGLPAVHLDFVGHAAVTDRLLQVDPDWTWEPMGRDEHGLPKLDAKGGLWISMTVCGVTRPGYGDETNGKGMKEIIGDAIRNAAMRFGTALDHWSKQELAGITSPDDSAETEEPELISDDQRGVLESLLAQTNTSAADVLAALAKAKQLEGEIPSLEQLPLPFYAWVLGALNAKAKKLAAGAA